MSVTCFDDDKGEQSMILRATSKNEEELIT